MFGFRTSRSVHAVLNEMCEEAPGVPPAAAHDSNEVFGPGSLRLSVDTLSTVPLAAVAAASEALSEFKEKIVLRHDAGRSLNIVLVRLWALRCLFLYCSPGVVPITSYMFEVFSWDRDYWHTYNCEILLYMSCSTDT